MEDNFATTSFEELGFEEDTNEEADQQQQTTATTAITTTEATTATDTSAIQGGEQRHPDSTDQQQSATEGNASQDTGKTYTEEELAEINERIKQGLPPKIDPERLPEVNKVLHKNLQALITRKSQQLSEKMREIEEIKKQLTIDTKIKKELMDNAVSTVKQELGNDYDELDPKTVIDINEKYNILLENRKNAEAETAYNSRVSEKLTTVANSLRATEPNFTQIDQLAENILNNLPAWQRDNFIAEAKSGNVEPFVALFNEAKKIFYSSAQSKQQKVSPPKTQSAGQGTVSKNKTNIDELLDLMGFSS